MVDPKEMFVLLFIFTPFPTLDMLPQGRLTRFLMQIQDTNSEKIYIKKIKYNISGVKIAPTPLHQPSKHIQFYFPPSRGQSISKPLNSAGQDK